MAAGCLCQQRVWTVSTISNKCRPPRRHLHWHELSTAAFAIAMLAATTAAAHADVRVNGNVIALTIEASESHVAEVLSALGPTLQVRVSTEIPLDRRINGSYTGSLRQVLSRVLEGYNYVLKRRDTVTEVIIVGLPGDRVTAAAPMQPAPARSLAAEWRNLTDKPATARQP
jgi:hypothetical protein